jgi:dTDP-glucose 4,6-dehydratase
LVLHADPNVVNGEVFNIASGQERTIMAIAKDVLGAMGGNHAAIENTSNRPGQVTRHTGDSAKIRNALGWEPEVTWAEGLRRTIKWYSENTDWWQKQIWMRHIPIITASGIREYH